jgi:DNA repair protein RecO (recombination protein O)
MPHLFDLSLEFLESVSQAGKSAETLLLAYIYKTLKMLGVAPEISCCVNCGKKPEDFGENSGFKSFSVTSGGIICSDCAKEEKTSGNALIYKPSFDIITVFVYFDSKPLKTFEKIDLKPEVLKQVRTILAEYIDRYLGTDVLSRSIGPEV